MKLLSLAAAAGFVAAAPPKLEDPADGVVAKCQEDGLLVIDFPYTTPNSQLTHIKVGTCEDVNSASVSFNQNDPAKGQITVDMDGCAANFPVGHATREEELMNVNRPADYNTRSGALNKLPIIAGYATFTVYFAIGGPKGEFIYEATINTECGTETEYEVTWDYGVVALQTHSADLRPGTYVLEPFQIKAYTDATYATEIDAANLPHIAGHPIFLGVSPLNAAFRTDRYIFAVTDCVYTNKANGQKIALFEYDENSCGNPFVNLQHTAVGNTWGFSHNVFVYGIVDSISTYSLTCHIKICDASAISTVCKSARFDCST